MRNYRKSDYAVNKYSKGIVYSFNGQTVEVTQKDYLEENPDKTSTDFIRLKALSDEIYLSQDRANSAYYKKIVPIKYVDEDVLFHTAESAETAALKKIKAEEINRKRKIAAQALNTLTEIQRRRLVMRLVNGFTLRKIAEIEGVGHTKIQKSIAAAEKKIKKYISGK